MNGGRINQSPLYMYTVLVLLRTPQLSLPIYYLIHLCLLLPATSPSPPLPQLSPLPFSTQLEQIVLLIVEKVEGRACVVGSVWTSGVVVMCIAYLPMFPMYLFRNLTPFKYISFAR